MANPPKKKGSLFESAFVKFMRAQLHDDRPVRAALHGSKDMGDVTGLHCHGASGIAELKNYKSYSQCHLDDWKQQTVRERENAGADFALLVVHEPGCGPAKFGLNSVYLQVRDLAKVMNGTVLAGPSSMDMWVRLTLNDLVRLMRDEPQE